MQRRLRVMYAVAGILIAVAVVCTGGSAADAVCVADVHVRVGIFRRTAGTTVAGKPDRRRNCGRHVPTTAISSDPASRCWEPKPTVQQRGTLSSQSAQDQRYGRLLNEGHGIMGRVSDTENLRWIIPIYHGTGDKQLSLGSGHLYGTSLPVGGNNTHAVITGHRGMVQAQMFTRLDEMREGDFIYISTMNRTLAYEVDRITVIEPTDTSQLRVVPGQDRLTLMTCTPYGINSHRLLVSGHRVSIPVPAPNPTDLHDGRTAGAWACMAVLLCGWGGIVAVRRRKRTPKGPCAMPCGCDRRLQSATRRDLVIEACVRIISSCGDQS